MPYGNLNVIKTQLGIPLADTSEDYLLQILMGQTSTTIENWCDRSFSGQQTYAEYYSGDGSTDDNGFWGQTPGAFDSTTLLQNGVDYALQMDGPNGAYSGSGIVQQLTSQWDVPFSYVPGIISPFVGPPDGDIFATYVAGFPTAPADLQLALFLQIAAIRNGKNYGQLLSSESRNDGAGSQSYSLAAKSMAGILTPEVRSILARYRNCAIG
jgi:hypothetical protein